MISEAKIRDAIEVLESALTYPCDCAETGHVAECEGGRMLLKANIDALLWVIGEKPRYAKGDFTVMIETIRTWDTPGQN